MQMKSFPRYEQLYQYGKLSSENQKLMRELVTDHTNQFTFHPQIKDYDCEKTRQGFFERQQQDCREREFKMLKAQEANSTAALRRSMMPRVNSAPNRRVVLVDSRMFRPCTRKHSDKRKY